jgi:hypothetical protein
LKDLFSKTILRVSPEGITSAKNGVLLFAQTKYVVFILDASIFFARWPPAKTSNIPFVSRGFLRGCGMCHNGCQWRFFRAPPISPKMAKQPIKH